jgi:hypothetical protein
MSVYLLRPVSEMDHLDHTEKDHLDQTENDHLDQHPGAVICQPCRAHARVSESGFLADELNIRELLEAYNVLTALQAYLG